MAHQKGRDGTVEVSSDGGSNYFTIGGITEFSIEPSYETIDATDFDSNGAKESDYGEYQYNLSITMQLDESDNGQDKLLTAADPSSPAKYKYRVRTTSGSGFEQYVFDGKITSFPRNNTRNANVEATVEIESSGTVTRSTQ